MFGGEGLITALLVFGLLFSGTGRIDWASEFCLRMLTMTFDGTVIFDG